MGKRRQKNDQILNHEKRHLDLSEIFNKKINQDLRKYLEKNFECENHNDTDIENEVAKLIKKDTNHYKHEYMELQDRYDHEVDHGKNIAKQLQWNENIDCLLNEEHTDLCKLI